MTRAQTIAVALGGTILVLVLGMVLTQPRPSADVVFNALGTSGGSSGGSTQTPPTAPGIPGANVTEESAATSLTWTWGISTDCSGCAGILAYYLDVGTSAGASDVVNDAVISGGATSYTHDTLASQRATYYATVYAKSTGGTNSATSQSITNPTIDRAGPTVTGLAAGSIGQSSVTITWSTNEAATSQVRYGTSSGSYGSSTTESSSRNTNHSVELTGLIAGTTYYVQARGSDQYSNAGSSSEVSFTTSAASSTSSSGSSSSSSGTSSSTGSSSTTSSGSSSAGNSSSTTSSGTTSSGADSSSGTTSSTQTSQSTESSSGSSTPSTTTASSTTTSSKKSSTTASTPSTSTEQSTVTTESSAPTTVAPLVVDLTALPAEAPTLVANQSLTIKGTAQPNEAVTVYVYSEPKQYQTTADDSGSWSIDVPASELAAGSHRVELETASKPRKEALSFKVADESGTVPETAVDDALVAEEIVAEADRTQAWLLIALAAIGLLVVLWFAAHRTHAHYTQPQP